MTNDEMTWNDNNKHDKDYVWNVKVKSRLYV